MEIERTSNVGLDWLVNYYANLHADKLEHEDFLNLALQKANTILAILSGSEFFQMLIKKELHFRKNSGLIDYDTDRLHLQQFGIWTLTFHFEDSPMYLSVDNNTVRSLPVSDEERKTWGAEQKKLEKTLAKCCEIHSLVQTFLFEFFLCPEAWVNQALVDDIRHTNGIFHVVLFDLATPPDSILARHWRFKERYREFLNKLGLLQFKVKETIIRVQECKTIYAVSFNESTRVITKGTDIILPGHRALPTLVVFDCDWSEEHHKADMVEKCFKLAQKTGAPIMQSASSEFDAHKKNNCLKDLPIFDNLASSSADELVNNLEKNY